MPEQPSKCLWETREEIERTSRLREKWQLSTYPKWKMQPEVCRSAGAVLQGKEDRLSATAPNATEDRRESLCN